MQALICKDGQVKLAQVPKPKPGPDDVLIRVNLAGICNTDIEITRGYRDFPGILGHEFVGIVEHDPNGELTGKRVVSSITISCGECWHCRHNQVSHCLNRKTLGINDWDGAFAPYLTLPRRNIHLVPDKLTDIQAVLVEPLAAGMRVVEQVHIKPGDRVAVLGDGKLGILTALVLLTMGHNPILIGKHVDKLSLAQQWSLKTALLEEFRGVMDVTIDCTGSPKGLETAIKITRAMGTIVMKTTVAGKHEVDLSPIVVKEITLLGSRCGPFAPTLEMLSRQNQDLEQLVEAVYPLEQGEEALIHASRKGSRKILLRIN